MLFAFVRLKLQNEKVPVEWETAFDSLCDENRPVHTTSNYAIRIGPYEIKTKQGIARKTGNFETAFTEHMNTSLPGSLNICPRAVSPGKSLQVKRLRVTVRMC